MNITNKYDLPDAYVVMASKMVRKPQEGIYHVTGLCDSPLIRKLTMQYWDEIEVDVSDMMWAIDGVVMHEFIAKYSPPHTLTEELLEIKLNGVIIRGRPDLYHIVNDRGILEDHKTTSVWAFLLGEKLEWERQLNCYAYLYQDYGLAVHELKIQAKLRDWVKSKSYDHEYPDIPFLTKSIPLWDTETQERYIMSRLSEHMEDKPCTDQERWARQTTWAVKRKDRTKAIRVLKTPEEAQAWVDNAKDQNGLVIEERKGENIRCRDYCMVRNFCKEA